MLFDLCESSKRPREIWPGLHPLWLSTLGWQFTRLRLYGVRLPGSSNGLPLITGIERLPLWQVSTLIYGNARTQTRACDLDRIIRSEACG